MLLKLAQLIPKILRKILIPREIKENSESKVLTTTHAKTKNKCVFNPTQL